MVVEGDLANDRIAIFHVCQIRDDFLAIRPDFLDRIQDHIHCGKRKSTIGLRRIVVFLSVVFLHEKLPSRKLFGGRALAESQGSFGQWSKPLNVGV